MRAIRPFLLSLVLAAAAVPALAGDPEPGTTVEMPILVAPLAVDGKLSG